MTAFGSRLQQAVAARGPLCVGIDPHEALLAEWGLDATAAGAREFGLRVVEAAAERVGVVKPQVSFFERYGSAGFAALEDVLAAARAAGLLVVADAKRGDIGTTMDAYAAAWLTPGSPLEADALTVSPYLGVGALASTLRFALRHDKGAFVLAATSNPEAAALQSARMGEVPVAAAVAAEVAAFDAQAADGAWSSLGLVVGATVDLAARGLVAPFARTLPLLAPGFGAQGAEPGDLARVFGPFADGVLASESRSILSAGPEGVAARIEKRAALYRGRSHG
ncbi:orotidine-5'-phosphate decarboxylase [Microbacterium sp. W1N]|uniref:orotidine-5'-phosphate decarboxylase n=1 Tax=Microbacterium festucae TaxID=2977531 RepID=UPI0021C0FB3C|nr:orotidine-5'-phosphate decarboxylase [Microbacterium festucae]MCT9820226.1 orotidine-5'-phosphate decarboxylase [Microbacterium festucae]